MGFLKKIGSIILKGAAIATGYGPMIGALAPAAAGTVTRVTDIFSKLAGLVITGEAMGQALKLPGDQKLAAVTPLAIQMILQSDVMLGRKVKDQAKFAAASATIVSGLADLLNSLDDDIAVENKAA